MVAHHFNCSCSQCKDLGGILNLIQTYQVSDFTDIKLRKIYAWLIKSLILNSCQFKDLDFNDPTAPKSSDIVNCCAESIRIENIDEKRYLLLKDILCNT